MAKVMGNLGNIYKDEVDFAVLALQDPAFNKWYHSTRQRATGITECVTA